jgi:hypothetical protein
MDQGWLHCWTTLAFGGVLSWFRKDIGWQFIPASAKELPRFVQQFGYGLRQFDIAMDSKP